MSDVLMPRLSDTMEEGTLSQWLKHEGDQVRKGDILAVIETDKAAMEMEAYDEGVLTSILVGEGSSVPIGTPIAVIGTAESGVPAPPLSASQPAAPPPSAGLAPPGQRPAAPAAVTDRSPPDPRRAAPAASPAGQVLASPLARRLARSHGIDLATVRGTGPGGRIVRADIEDGIGQLGSAPTMPESATASHTSPAEPAPAPPAAAPAAGDSEEVPLSTVRRITAERLAASAREAPHFYLTVVANADELLAFRARVNEARAEGPKISLTDLLIKACATALTVHPEINVSFDQTRILRHRRVNIGVAVAIDDGLVVPVLTDADRKTLTEISREAHDLATRARARRLAPDELTGGTFTMSNLGMFGIRQFTAVINPPQAAILAVGAATREPVARGDQVAIGTTMTLTLSIDHRAVDGATGAVFLTGLRDLIEEPLSIVL